MNCDEVKALLSEYVDEVLAPETRAFVDEHLSACDGCQRELVSLRALVSDLGSLESVEPPRDFLDQLHERLEKRSWFSEVLRTLFVPMRVKIPLEFAGAAALAVLVFSFLYTQKDQLKLVEAPVSVKNEMATQEVLREQKPAGEAGITKKGPADTFGKVAKDEAYKPQLAYRAAEQPPTERETVELALVLRKDLRPEALAPGAAMEGAPAPKKKMRRSLAMRDAETPARPEKEEAVDDPLTKVKRFIGLVGGEVVSVEYNKETHRPESIRAEIPSEQLHTFYNKLKELGDLQAPPEPVTGKSYEVVPVSIRLLPEK